MPSGLPVSSSDTEGPLVRKGQRAEEASVGRQVNIQGRLYSRTGSQGHPRASERFSQMRANAHVPRLEAKTRH